MSAADDRRWWPFPVKVSAEAMSLELRDRLDFLDEAVRGGLRAYLENNELFCGAISDSGRDCLIIWRGRQRAELILRRDEEVVLKKLFSELAAGEAFRCAAGIGIRWTRDGTCDFEMQERWTKEKVAAGRGRRSAC